MDGYQKYNRKRLLIFFPVSLFFHLIVFFLTQQMTPQTDKKIRKATEEILTRRTIVEIVGTGGLHEEKVFLPKQEEEKPKETVSTKPSFLKKSSINNDLRSSKLNPDSSSATFLPIKKDGGQVFTLPEQMLIPGFADGHISLLDSELSPFFGFKKRSLERVGREWLQVLLKTFQDSPLLPEHLAPETYVSVYEFVLNADGEIEHTHLRISSGVHDLDLAPSKAAKNIHTIPNPPKSLFNEDQQIRLFFSFHVKII